MSAPATAVGAAEPSDFAEFPVDVTGSTYDELDVHS